MITKIVPQAAHPRVFQPPVESCGIMRIYRAASVKTNPNLVNSILIGVFCLVHFGMEIERGAGAVLWVR